jgi:hypothetical protein
MLLNYVPLFHKQDPTDYANRDYFATVVESIISHEPVKDKNKNLVN